MGIHEAARRGEKPGLLKILEFAPDSINAKDEKGCTPLWIACRQGHTAVVRSILGHAKYDCSMVNTICESEHTPLQIAVCFARDEIVKLLLAQPGIKLNTTDNNGHTPLTLAVKKGFESTVNLLLDMEGIDLGPDGARKTPLATAFECGQLTIASHLVNAERRRNPTKTYQTLLSWASENDKRDLVRRINDLYTTNPNLHDGDGHTPLSKAAERGNLSMVRLLLENSAIDVNSKNKDGSTPMSRAAANQHKNVVQLLAAKDNVTLHFLVRTGNLELTDCLLGCDVNIDCKDDDGMTALHIVIISRHLQIIDSLLSRGAHIDVKDGAGRTPLIIAVQHGFRDLVELLLSRSAYTLRNSENVSGGSQVHFVDTTLTPQDESEMSRRLFRASSFTDWTSLLPRPIIRITVLESNRGFNFITFSTEQSRLPAVAITVWVPVIGMFTQSSEWDGCGIAWTMSDDINNGGFGRETKDHYSMLPDGWIPENGTEFFKQLIAHLTTRWAVLCNGAEDLLSEQKGRSEIINDLAGDGQNVAELRHCLRAQVHQAKTFVGHFAHLEGVGLYQQSIKAIEAFAGIDESLQELDQTIRDLLQLEFAWVSINEAHKSTSLGTSMKRLSWITVRELMICLGWL
ncbi:unnamed protein product [Fusarium equiseti]|uniref:Ankyrin n=1 Tax=Fusarium equiseti TaxID=61235 RepID=A0A8J2NHC4_FUSEQ|nr:unnamed protein product [Fusarium equiseti]